MKKDEKSIHLLLIEDNPGDALLVEEYVRDSFQNADFTHADTYKRAEELLKLGGKTYDSILLDLSLPDLEGIELVQQVLNLSGTAPVIVLTGYSNLDFSIESLSVGVSDYLLKDELTSILLHKSILYSIERSAFSEKLKKSEKNYRHLFEFSPVPMWVYDLHTLHFLDVNEAAIKHYGYSKEIFMEMRIRDIRPPEDVENFENVIDNVRDRPNKKGIGIFRHQKKSGEIIQVQVEESGIEYRDRDARLVLADDITEQKKYEKKLTDSLKEKEVLLSEIHHRVKNNLAVISSLLQLQAFNAKNKELEKKLYDSVFRISTMATIHEILYKSGSFSKIDFSDIIEQLVFNLEKIFGENKEIEHQINSHKIELNINQAIPCSLMINEVVTNVYKHAFRGRKDGVLTANLTIENDEVLVIISDNGIGFPDNMDMDNSDTMGLQLIQVLTAQLKGESAFSSDETGTTFTLKFSKTDVSGSGSNIMN